MMEAKLGFERGLGFTFRDFGNFGGCDNLFGNNVMGKRLFIVKQLALLTISETYKNAMSAEVDLFYIH
jgi:hypothetical protein